MEAPGVLLVGRRLQDNSNLGLEYLLAALGVAGLRGEIAALNSWRDLEPIAERVGSGGLGLVGLSLPDGGTSPLALGLGELLRRRGFEGHITCGGGFATLARGWLLERYEWLDSVVRFAGERPIVELARALGRGTGAAGVPGVTTRAGDGLPAPVADALPLTLRPARDELPEILGLPLAHMAATRGCPARCAYCGPAALQALERSEAARGGISAGERSRAGIGATRRRDLDDVCDEMAELWHGRGVRYFYFTDESILPWDGEEAVGWLRRWKHGLDLRRVGRMGIGIMIRGDRIEPDVARAFVEVGLVRAFVGLELASDEELARFGRSTGAPQARRAIEVFDRLGVATVANLLLVHPYSTPETVARGIESLSELPAGAIETTQMMVYHGTRLHERLSAEGRLRGNPLRHAYTFADPAVERFAQIFARLRAEAFRDYSVSYGAHDAALALALARRVRPEVPVDAAVRRVARASAACNGARLDALRRALALALEGGGFADCDRLVQEARAAVALPMREIEDVVATLESRLGRPASIHAPLKTAAASVLTFCLSATAPAGCDCGYTARPGSDAAVETDAAVDAEADAAADAAPACTSTEIAAAQDEVRALVAGAGECASARIWFDASGVPEFDLEGQFDQRYCPGAVDDVAAALRKAFGDRTWPCLAGTYFEVTGTDAADRAALLDRLYQECSPYELGYYELRIVVGPDGTVADVQSSGSASDEALDCVRSALAGLVFPCLANRQICPEFVIAE